MKKARPKPYTLYIRVPDGTGEMKLFPETDEHLNGVCVFKFKVMSYDAAMREVQKYEAEQHSVWLWQGQHDYHLLYASAETMKTGSQEPTAVE